MNSDDIICEIVAGERDLIDDAADVSQREGLTIEVRHEAGDAAVVLSYDPTTAWECDHMPSEDLSLFDIHEVAVEKM